MGGESVAGGALSFREDPFRLTPDRRFIFETDGFRRAFTMLLAGVRARRGAMLLTGPSGTGKTTLLQGLRAKLQQDGATVFWRFHPDTAGHDLVGSCLAELDVKDASADPVARACLLASAVKTRAPSQPAVLVVDEAGQFSDTQIAELLALPVATDSAVQVVLAGLPVLAERLKGEALASLRDAVALRAELGPLGRNELGAYIAHRCRVAGQSSSLVFEPAAIDRVFDHTGGTPRLVNRLCAAVLFFAAPGARQISPAMVDEAASAGSGDLADRPPQATGVPASSAARPPNVADLPSTPAQRPVLPEAQSEMHRTLAEAERAWISGSGAQPHRPTVPDSARASSPAWPAERRSGGNAPAIDPPFGTPPRSSIDPTRGEPVATGTPPRRRAPALRIAASIALVGGAAAALTAVLWPTPIGRVYLAESPPARAAARLDMAEHTAQAPSAPPIVAEAIVPPQPVLPAAPGPTEAVANSPVSAPADTSPQPLVATADHVVPGPAIPERIANEAALPEPPALAAENSEPAAPLTAHAAEMPLPPPEPVAAAPAAVLAETVGNPGGEATPSVAESVATIAPASGVADIQHAVDEETAPAAPHRPDMAGSELDVAAAAKAPETTSLHFVPPAPAAVAVTAVVAPVPPAPEPVAPRSVQASLPAADPIELKDLMARGDAMMRLGDPASARLFYERATARGLARGFTAVGSTYDPLALQRLGIRSGGANAERALDWYRRGANAGDPAAAKASGELTTWLAQPRR